MRTNPEATDDFRIGKKIERPEPEKPKQPHGLSTNIPVPHKTLSDYEMIREDMRRAGKTDPDADVSTGWIQNPDRVKVPATYEERLSDLRERRVKMFTAVRETMDRLDSARQVEVVQWLEQSKADGTLRPALDAAAERHRLSLLDEPRSWASLMDELKELRAQVASEQSERVRLSNLVLALGGEP